ncbi:MAG: hypothetical protein ACT4PG_09400 [Panacagrimonas sp.]
MRAFVFSEAQIDPALQRWFGAQQLTTEQELQFRADLVAFLTSAQSTDLRMTQFDPVPSMPLAAAAALEEAA